MRPRAWLGVASVVTAAFAIGWRVGRGEMHAAIVALGLAAGPGVAQVMPVPDLSVGRVRAVQFAPAVIAELEGIADTATVEHYRCLMGDIVPLTPDDSNHLLAVIDSLVDPGLSEPATPSSVFPNACPANPVVMGAVFRGANTTLGEWHSHRSRSYIDGKDLGPLSPKTVCALSSQDRRGGVRLSVVSAGKGVTCAFWAVHGQPFPDGTYWYVTLWRSW